MISLDNAYPCDGGGIVTAEEMYPCNGNARASTQLIALSCKKGKEILEVLKEVYAKTTDNVKLKNKLRRSIKTLENSISPKYY